MSRRRVVAPDQAIAAAARQWDGLTVICAGKQFNGIKMAEQHMAEELSRLGPVLYVDPPLSLITARRDPAAAALAAQSRLRLLGPGLAHLTPIVPPGPYRPGLTPLTTALVRRYVRSAVRRLGGWVRAVVSVGPQFLPAGSCQERVRVYWALDDYLAGADLLGLSSRSLAAREQRVVAAADFVLAVSPVLAGSWRDRGFPVQLLPNGVDVAAYAGVDTADPPADAADLPGPVAGLVGHINGRADLALLEAVADRGRSLLLVGPVKRGLDEKRFDALTRRHNVRWVGAKPSSALPGYLRLMDVGLVPYQDTLFNRGSFPLKTLEYLAAGRGVVATDLPAVHWLATDLVAVASGPGHFADQVDRMLTEDRSPALMAARRALAARHSWSSRAETMHEAILSCSRHNRGKAGQNTAGTPFYTYSDGNPR
ncbi:MAG TPA: glycosyltransferase [Streptosporangiaceae bacterium]|nr:glycosyltransferase [Streptosporangiaceae bacterium]